jgi:hypothetical protein
MNINSLQAHSVFNAFDVNHIDINQSYDDNKKKFIIVDSYSVEGTKTEYSFNNYQELSSKMKLLLQKFNVTDDTFQTLDVAVFQTTLQLVYFLTNNTYIDFRTLTFEGGTD